MKLEIGNFPVKEIRFGPKTAASASTFVLGMYTSEGMLNPGKTKLVVWAACLAPLRWFF